VSFSGSIRTAANLYQETFPLSKKKSGLWSFLKSVKLTLVLLTLIIILAVVGTLVPQREAAFELSDRFSPTLWAFLSKAQIFDLYHSIWFFALMGLFALNLIVCSIDRFPEAWRRFRRRPAPDDPDVFAKVPSDQVLRTSRSREEAAAEAQSLLQKRLGRPARAEKSDAVYLAAGRGRFGHLGVYIVHLSLLVLIAGVVVGSLFGVEGYLQISEGETVKTLHLRDGKGTLPLPFGVRCDRFKVEFYDTGTPKTYQSDLTFFKNDRIALQGNLLVNHPITFEGFRFYQSTFGRSPDGMATLSLLRPGGKKEVLNVRRGYWFDLPGGEGLFHVLRVEDNLMNMGPAVKISVRPKAGGEDLSFWIFEQVETLLKISPDIFEQVPVFNPGLFKPYRFALLGLEQKYYTGLQVSRDPGVPLVAVSAVILMAGLMLLLMTYPRQIWIRVDAEGEMTRVSFAGRSFKNAAGLNREIQHLSAELARRLENTE